MLDSIKSFFADLAKKISGDNKSGKTKKTSEKAKERLHIVLVQDRANISTDYLELMKQEIIDVIKKYVVVDEGKIDVRFTNSVNNDGTYSAPTLYANVPILNIRNEMKAQKLSKEEVKKQEELEDKVDEALKKDEQFQTMQVVLEAKEEKKVEETDLLKALEETAEKQRKQNKKETEQKEKKKNKNKSKDKKTKKTK